MVGYPYRSLSNGHRVKRPSRPLGPGFTKNDFLEIRLVESLLSTNHKAGIQRETGLQAIEYYTMSALRDL